MGNAIAHARRMLVREGILKEEDEVKGKGYLLLEILQSESGRKS